MQELQHEFLNYLQDNLSAGGLYADPDLSLQKHAAEISDSMVDKVSDMLQKMAWDKPHVADFLGRYLTEPKLDVVFEQPRKISKLEFTKRLATKTLCLSLKSQLLFTHDHFYLNGEKLNVSAEIVELMKHLADQKSIQIAAMQVTNIKTNGHAACSDALYDAYLAGYVYFK